MRDQLWRELRELFEDDDGSLPEIQLLGVVSAADVVHRGIALPDLGVRVDRGGDISVDYRPGPRWNTDTLAGLIELLGDIRALTPGTRLVAADPLGAPWPDKIQHRFSSAVETYLATA